MRREQAEKSPNGASPRVLDLSWGHLEVEGASPFEDAKLFPGGATAWTNVEKCRGHREGIRPADVAELVEHGARVVVLSQGFYGRLPVEPETLDWLGERGVTWHIRPTPEAVALYERLREIEAVGALLHTRC